MDSLDFLQYVYEKYCKTESTEFKEKEKNNVILHYIIVTNIESSFY